MFVNKVPRRQFKTYHCISSERAKEIAIKDMSEDAKAEFSVHTEVL